MSQQINLINPALIKQKDFLTVVNIGAVCGVLLVLMLGWYAYLASQVTELTRTQQALVDEVAQTQAALAQLVASRAPRSPDPALLKQLASLESKQQVQEKILHAIQQRKPQLDRGLASYMRGFARQTMEGVWLTGFSIDETNKTMTVRGRSLEAESLPNYVQKLGKEPVFAGKHFGGLRIKQAEVAKADEANGRPADLPARPVTTTHASPLFVEFELQGLEILPIQTANQSSGENKS